MTLAPGSRLGHYEVLAPLGAGGMGEVYRARDSRLGRDVAIKLLPDSLAQDAERLARFEREAKLLAAIHHAHVATVFGLEELGGRRVLVMECVEGETLAQRLTRGPLSVPESVDLCGQIALGLEAAHDAGIVHRDLKPANVQITPAGEVKVLDFGLARGAPVAVGSSPDLSQSPTMPVMGTAAGMILGTAAYMSPEQARGRAVDRRTDVWAFGCVLYECLSGRQAFEGETISDMIARILEREPDWSKLPATVPPALRELLARCLAKDARQRLRDIADVRLELERSLTAPAVAKPAAGVRSLAPVAAIALLAGAAATFVALRFTAPAPSPATHLSLTFPADLKVNRAFEGWTGATLGFSAAPRDSGAGAGRGAAYVRRLDSYEVHRLAGTEGLDYAALSPDRRWFVFSAPPEAANGKRRLMRRPNEGDAPAVELGPVEEEWASLVVLANGDMLAAPPEGGSITRISPDGKRSTPVAIDAGAFRGWVELLWALPGDRGVLLNLRAYLQSGWSYQVGLLDLETMKLRVLIERGGNARYDGHGHLLFARGDNLLAAPFDAGRLAVTGPPVAVMNGLRTGVSYEPALFALDLAGNLYFEPGGAVANQRHLGILEPDGRVSELPIEPRAYKNWVTASRDGARFVVRVTNGDAIDDLWVGEVDPPAVRRRLALPSADASSPCISPDGKRIAFTRAGRDSLDGLYLLDVDAQDFGRRIVRPESLVVRHEATGWSADGRTLLFNRSDGARPGDLWMLRFDERGETVETVRPLLQTAAEEADASFLADERWITYRSNESGQNAVYIAPIDAAFRLGAPTRIAAANSELGEWAPGGNGLVVRRRDGGVFRLPITLAARPAAGTPSPWFRRQTNGIEDFALLPGGRGIAVLRGPLESEEMTSINVILGWVRTLPALMAAGRR